MNALSIHGDSWHGVFNDEWHVDNPSWSEVDEAIQRLDAKRYTLLTIQGPGEQHLAVGGGAGRYVVYATFDNCVFWNLLGGNVSDETAYLIAGGQEGDYPATQIVNFEQAYRAARTFFADLRLDPNLQWAEQ